MTFTFENINLNAWIVWLVLTLGITVFVTRSMWCAFIRVLLIRWFDSYAGYCGGCVGFWVGLVTAYFFPLSMPWLGPWPLSTLAGMLLGYWFGGGDLVLPEQRSDDNGT